MLQQLEYYSRTASGLRRRAGVNLPNMEEYGQSSSLESSCSVAFSANRAKAYAGIEVESLRFLSAGLRSHFFVIVNFISLLISEPAA
jgi:hypothetical protein